MELKKGDNTIFGKVDCAETFTGGKVGGGIWQVTIGKEDYYVTDYNVACKYFYRRTLEFGILDGANLFYGGTSKIVILYEVLNMNRQMMTSDLSHRMNKRTLLHNLVNRNRRLIEKQEAEGKALGLDYFSNTTDIDYGAVEICKGILLIKHCYEPKLAIKKTLLNAVEKPSYKKLLKNAGKGYGNYILYKMPECALALHYFSQLYDLNSIIRSERDMNYFVYHLYPNYLADWIDIDIAEMVDIDFDEAISFIDFSLIHNYSVNPFV